MSSALKSLGGIAKSAGITFVGIVIGSALGLVGEAAIARSLTVTAYGHLALAYTIVSMAGSLAGLGLSDGVTRLMSADQSPERRRAVLRSGYVIALVGGFLGVVFLYALRFRIAAVVNDEQLPRIVVLLLPYLLFYTVAWVSFGALRASKAPTRAAISQHVGPKTGGLLVFGALTSFGAPLFGAVGYWLALPFGIAVFSLFFLRREMSLTTLFSRLPDRETVSELWSFSWPLAVGTPIFLVLSNFDLLMIGYFLDPSAVGYYRVIQPLRQIATFVLGSFSFLYLPVATEYFADGDFEGLNEIYSVSTKWIVAITFPLILVFALFAPDVIRAFFGAKYTPAAPALRVLVAGLFFRAVVGLNGDMVRAIDRPRIELISAVGGALVNVVLNVAFIPRFGIAGAALATVIGYAVYNTIEVTAIYRTTGSHPFSANSLVPLVPTTLVGLAIVWLTSGYQPGLPVLIGIGMILAATHLLSMVLTRSLDEADVFLVEQVEAQTGIDLAWLKSTVEGDS